MSISSGIKQKYLQQEIEKVCQNTQKRKNV